MKGLAVIQALKSARWWALLLAWFLQYNLGYVWYGPLFGGLIGRDPSDLSPWVLVFFGFTGFALTLGSSWIALRLAKKTLKASLATALILMVFFALPLSSGNVATGMPFLVDFGYYCLSILIAVITVNLTRKEINKGV